MCEWWLERAADQELAEAQWALGLLYKDYRNDEEISAAWFKKAIANFERRTDAEAYRVLYGMYSAGLGSEVNRDKAKEYALKYVVRCREEKTQPQWGVLSPEVRDYVVARIGL